MWPWRLRVGNKTLSEKKLEQDVIEIWGGLPRLRMSFGMFRQVLLLDIQDNIVAHTLATELVKSYHYSFVELYDVEKATSVIFTTDKGDEKQVILSIFNSVVFPLSRALFL